MQHELYRHETLARFRKLGYLPHYNGKNAIELDALATLMLQEFTHSHEPNEDALSRYRLTPMWQSRLIRA